MKFKKKKILIKIYSNNEGNDDIVIDYLNYMQLSKPPNVRWQLSKNHSTIIFFL